MTERGLRSQIRGIGRVEAILLLILAILGIVFLFLDIAYVIPIVGIVGGIVLIYAGRANPYVATLGGIIVVLGFVDALLINFGGGLAL